MNALSEIKSRFASVLSELTADFEPLLDMIRPAGNPEHGDYQANCAMPLKKILDQPSRQIAESIVEAVDLDDFCQSVEIAGPGFINLKLDDDWIQSRLQIAIQDKRLGVSTVDSPKTYVVDYSSPNAAKPMHVGHIRSTVIGDAISKVFRFLGHQVITDNHLGDWGTQFGMIIYGYKHFRIQADYDESPVKELSRLYRYVRMLIDYHAAKQKLPGLKVETEEQKRNVEQLFNKTLPSDKSEKKRARKEIKNAEEKLTALVEEVNRLESLIESIDSQSEIKLDADSHPTIGSDVLDETAKLNE
ncbi:MAG: arginine--tRNA ligase, partial [Planctomycetota bacterium]